MSAVLLQTYAPCAELEGRDGLLACDEDLARRLVDEGRGEIMNPWAEAFRYVPGTPAYVAMRAHGAGEVTPTSTEPETSQLHVTVNNCADATVTTRRTGPNDLEVSVEAAPPKRGPGRPRNQEALL
jgi:hypothetical protein